MAGMRDVLVCLDAKTGQERWRFDFVRKLDAPVPDFGFVCSPLVDGEAVYVQAGAGFAKLNKRTGALLWHTLKDQGGMWGSVFSSPVIAELCGKRQILVQTRESPAGVDLATGTPLWTQPVKAFRGMNILTPVPFGDGVFTSVYRRQDLVLPAVAGKRRVQGSPRLVLQGRGLYVHAGLIQGVATNTSGASASWRLISARARICGRPARASGNTGALWPTAAGSWRSTSAAGSTCSMPIPRSSIWWTSAGLPTRRPGRTWRLPATQLFIRELKALAVWRWPGRQRPFERKPRARRHISD